jgi:septal ring factor EnvC (AmiA/AmiB activator)
MAQDAKYKMSIKEIAKLQKQKIEQMFRDHQLEKDELEATKKALSQEIEVMITQHKETREKVEQDIWDSIDQLKED